MSKLTSECFLCGPNTNLTCDYYITMLQEVSIPGAGWGWGGIQKWKRFSSENMMRVGGENFKVEKHTAQQDMV